MTPAEIKAGMKSLFAIAGAVKEAGEVPAGTIYAAVTQYMTLDALNKAVGLLVRESLVQRSGNTLRWIGPK